VFARIPVEEAGRFPLTGRGDVNTYALFAELFTTLASKHGRAGVIVPTGIATDATTAPFFAALVTQKRLVQLIDFENRDAIFPTVHRSYKFSLLTIGQDTNQSDFAFFLTDARQLAEPERRFTLSAEDIARINPNTNTAPVFRSRTDAELTSKIYARVPVLIDDAKGQDGNPWGLSFMAMFHMANDSGMFRTAVQLAEAGFVRDGSDWITSAGVRPRQDMLALVGGHDDRSFSLEGGSLGSSVDRYIPLYEAKLTWAYDHRASSYHLRGESRGHRVLPSTPLEEHQNPNFEPEPFYWVPLSEVDARLRERDWSSAYLLGWRDITTAIAERTMVPCVIPRVGCGDTFLLAFPAPQHKERLCALYANWASLPFDYMTRQKIAYVHLKYNIVKQLATFPPSFYTSSDLAFIVPRVLELTYTSHSMTSFARDLGYNGPPFPWDEDRRAQMRAELDAWYARAYGLTRDELRYILDPADVKGSDYPSETFRLLKADEIRRGEYRTARLLLHAWDVMAVATKAAE
jgi:hypothetical protein